MSTPSLMPSTILESVSLLSITPKKPAPSLVKVPLLRSLMIRNQEPELYGVKLFVLTGILELSRLNSEPIFPLNLSVLPFVSWCTLAISKYSFVYLFIPLNTWLFCIIVYSFGSVVPKWLLSKVSKKWTCFIKGIILIKLKWKEIFKDLISIVADQWS